MSNGINLLATTNKGLGKNEGKVKTLKLIALISIILVGLSSVTVFLLTRQFSVSSIENQQKSILQQMKIASKKETKIVIINNRLKAISDILLQRIDYSQIVKALSNKIPAEVSVDKLVISDKKISIMVSSASLLSINTVIDNFVDMAKKKDMISSVILDSLSMDKKLSFDCFVITGVEYVRHKFYKGKFGKGQRGMQK